MKREWNATIMTVLGVLACVVFIAGILFGVPRYRVWTREMQGRAMLAEAEWSRQILITEANARLEAARLDAQAEVERARGMAQAMEIEGGMLTPLYIQYLWVLRNQFDNNAVVYIPTEANLPILEAGRTLRLLD